MYLAALSVQHLHMQHFECGPRQFGAAEQCTWVFFMSGTAFHCTKFKASTGCSAAHGHHFEG